jgi:hypothetical protein
MDDFSDLRLPYLVSAKHDIDPDDPIIETMNNYFGWDFTDIGDGLFAGPLITDGVPGQGILAMTTSDNAPGDGINGQWHTACFTNIEDKFFYFTCRAKFTDTTAKVFGGIADIGANCFTGNPKGIFFTIGVANPQELICSCRDGSGITSVTVEDLLPNGTWGTISFRTDGDTAYFYASDLLVATITTHVPSNLPFAPTMGFISGAAAKQSLFVDYIKMMMER